MCRLRWTAGNCQMLCYMRPFLNPNLTIWGKLAYTMANWGWVIGMLIWALLSYVMIGWIVFQVSHADSGSAVLCHDWLGNFQSIHCSAAPAPDVCMVAVMFS